MSPRSAAPPTSSILLLLLLPAFTFQTDCFPDNSTFDEARCSCGTRGRIIRCFNEPLQAFPVVGRIYSNVEEMVIEDSHFTELNRSHMQWYPNIQTIIFRDGRLSKISNDAFKNNTKVIQLHILRHHLTIMPPVKDMTSLTRMSVEGNYISSINPGNLDGCVNLFDLNAAYNDIRHLKSGALRDLTMLAYLNLTGNRGLSRIDDDAFETTPIQHMYLAHTAISHLPSLGLRNSLNELDLTETRNLKRFNAYETDALFQNQTYPFLTDVKFFYHAHCCQMRNYHTLFIKAKREDNTETKEQETPFLMPMDEEANGLENYVCVNITNMTVVQNTSEVSFAQVKVSDAEEFCSSRLCLPEVCGARCSEDDMMGGEIGDEENGGSGGGMMLDVYCIERVSFSCLDKFFENESFVAEIKTNSCNIVITEPTASPTTPSPPPPPPPPCSDKEAWCEYNYPGDSGCLTCHDTCTDICPFQYPAIVCACPGKKRSLRESEGYQGYRETEGYRERSTTTHLVYTRDTIDNNNTNNSTNDSSMMDDDSCIVTVEDVICRKRLNFSTTSSSSSSSSSSLVLSPTPTPSVGDGDSNVTGCDSSVSNLDGIGEMLLPLGWFYPNPESRDTICTKEIPTTEPPTNETTTTPMPVILNYVQGPLVTCEPVPNAFNPCSDLLGGNNVLRAAIWFVIIFAIIGNGSVLFVFVVYLIIIRRMKVKFFPMHFLYANLAAADFLMSIYLLTLASVDADTKGHFSLDDIEWRTGAGCGFAGFCAITSTVVSVYTLVVITSERLYTISFVFRQKKFTKQFALVVMIVGWIIGIVIGALPLGGTVNSYELVAVCLPFDTNNGSALAYISILLLATGLAFVYIAVCYGIIFYQIVLSPKRRSLIRGSNEKQWKADLRMSIRMFVLVVTNFLCWFPIALVSLTAAFGTPLHGINVETAKVFVVFVFPLNACLNPFLYSLSTRAFKRHSREILSRCGLCKDSKYLSTYSNAFGLPSSGSGRTMDTTASRRSSVISHLISLNFTMFRNHQENGNSNDNSMTNLRRPSEASINSNEDRFLRLHTLLNLRRSSGMSQSSNEDDPASFMQLGPPPQSQTSDPLSTTSAGLQNKHRNTLNSASSLGVLHEVDEVADIPNANGLIQHNPGYLDQSEADCEEDILARDTCIMDGETVSSIGGGSKEQTPSVTDDDYTVVIKTLQTDSESNKCSDSQSITDDIQTHTDSLS